MTNPISNLYNSPSLDKATLEKSRRKAIDTPEDTNAPSPAAKAAKTYPELPDPDGPVAALVEGILETSNQVEALSGNLEILKGERIAIAKPFYFAHHAGQMAGASSVDAKAGDKLVRVGFSTSHRGTADDAAILRVTGESRNRWDRLTKDEGVRPEWH